MGKREDVDLHTFSRCISFISDVVLRESASWRPSKGYSGGWLEASAPD